MSKRSHNLTNRLEELFSTPTELEAKQPQPAEPEEVSAAAAGPAHPDRGLFAQAEASFVKTILNQLPMPIYVKDRDHKWVAVNPAFCRLIGKPADAVIGYTDKEQSDDDWQRDDQVFETGLADETQQALNRPDGSPFTRSIRRAPLKNVAGDVDYLVTIIEDAAQESAAQESAAQETAAQEPGPQPATTQPAAAAERTVELIKAAEALQQSESFYHSLVEVLPQCICRKDLEGRFTFANRLFCEDIGRPLADLLGKTDDDIHPPELAEKYRRDDQHVVDTGQVVDIVEERAVLGGETAYVQTIKAPIRNIEGKTIGVQIMFWDVTERKRAEEALRRMHEELEVHVQERTAELAAINRLSRELTHLAEPAQIIETINTTIGELIDNRNLYIALYDEANRQISFPLYTIDGERRDVSGRPMANGMTEYLLRTKAPLLIPHDVEGEAQKLGIGSFGREAKCWLGAPLLAGDQAIGVITLQNYDQADVYTPEHVELLTTIAAQAAIALENARLFAEVREGYARTQASLNNAQALYQASRAIGEADSPEAIGQALMDYVSTTGIDAARVLLFDHDEQGQPTHIVMREGWTVDNRPVQAYNTRLPMADYPLTSLMSHEQPIIVRDMETDHRLNDLTRMFIIQLAGLRSAALVPLAVGDRWIGTLFVGRNNPSTYSDDLIRGYWTLAGEAAVATENARLFKQTQAALAETRRLARREQTLGSITSRIYAANNIKRMLQITAEELRQATGSARAVVRLNRVGLRPDRSAIQQVPDDK